MPDATRFARGLIVATAACGQTLASNPPSATTERTAAADVSQAPGGPAPAASPTPSPSLPTLEALAARAPSFARGMREVARGDLTGGLSPTASLLVRAEASDTCVRVALVANPPVHASVVDARADVLADVTSAADTPIAPRGPVCVRKGDVVTLRVEGTGTWTARFVAWASP